MDLDELGLRISILKSAFQIILIQNALWKMLLQVSGVEVSSDVIIPALKEDTLRTEGRWVGKVLLDLLQLSR